MAIQAVSLVVLWFLAFSAAQNTCGEVQCKLVPVERDVALTFQKLASEKSVRLVFFNLEIMSNDSFHSFESKERSFAKRWVWVTTLTEPMLFLPDDYDIYSLGLLKYQVRYMNMHLEEQPTGCLARLNTSCQDNALGETLLGNVVKVTKVSSDNHLHQKDFVCTTYARNFSSGNDLFSNPIDREWHYLCCSLQNFTEINDLLIRCGIRVESGWFLVSLNTFFYIFVVILGLYWPAIFLLLPDFLFNLQHEYEKENKREQHNEDNQAANMNTELIVNPGSRADEENSQVLPSQPNQQQNDNEQRVESEDVVNFPVRDDQETSDRVIPLDDASPITFCALLGDYAKDLPDLKINFNFKLFFLCFVVFPIFLHLKIALTLFHKFQFYQEIGTCQKQQAIGSIACSIMGLYNWRKKETFLNIMFLGGYVMLFLLLLFIRPKDLFSDQSVSISHEILQCLNIQRERVYDLTFIILEQFMDGILKRCFKKLTPSKTNLRFRKSRHRRAFRSLCILISAFPILLVVAVSGIFYIMYFLTTLGLIIVWFSPVATCYNFFKMKTKVNPTILANSKITRVILCVFGLISVLMLYTFFICVFFVSVTFIIHTFLLTIMGLVLNAEFVTPYAAFILVIARNMYLCYSNLQSRYKEVKGLISKHWREKTKDLPRISCSSNETIPKELFWFVCGNPEKKRNLSWSVAIDDNDSQEHEFVLPLRTEMCCMLREITLILLFLSLSLFFILSLKTMNDVSLLVSTIFVFISGAIPSLILGFAKERGMFSSWNKIRIEKKIKEAVKKYIDKLTGGRHSDELVQDP